MQYKNAKSFIESLAHQAGIGINSEGPADIQVHHPQFYNRVLSDGVLGLGESYMEKWWDCAHLDVFFEKILRVNLDRKLSPPLRFYLKLLLAKMINLQTKKRAKQVARRHYDLGNTLYEAMLDKHMMYSCAYFKDTHNLEEAQVAKLDLVCKKLNLKSGMSVLDIGCGFGGFAKYAAEHYDVKVTGITISEQQFKYAEHYCKGLPISIQLKDYRDIHDSFDRIVSIGMFEHVGHKNYGTYMQSIHNMLKQDGIFLLHTIGANVTSTFTNEWIHKYIFPNGSLPSIAQIAKHTERLFIMEDWHNFGAFYDKTLMAWHDNFKKNWDHLKSIYDETFYRMWTYYLLCCAGDFRARGNQLWQIVFSKKGLRGGYIAPR